MICEVCSDPITSGTYIYHARLGVYVHGDCPRTDVCGEDISFHAVHVGTAPGMAQVAGYSIAPPEPPWLEFRDGTFFIMFEGRMVEAQEWFDIMAARALDKALRGE